jgi:ribosomal protein S27E
MGPKKLALWFLIVSVALSAALGIIALLTGNFGELEIRIILTTLTISAASMFALASGALWEGRGKRDLPRAGIALSVLAAFLLIVGIWFEPSGEPYWKLSFSLAVAAAATGHACLISLATLSPRFAWSRLVTLAAIYLLAILIILAIFIEPSGDLGFRLIGASAIVVAALTIMVPIFHRLSRDDLNRAPATESNVAGGLFPTITCPQCGARQANSMTETTCDKCGCRFVTSILARGPITNH